MRPLQRRADAGFTAIELLVVLAITGTILAISLGGFTNSIDIVRGDSSMNGVMWQLKLARETAINQRRSIEIRFTMPNFMSVVRRNIPNGETVLSTAVLEHNTAFYVFPTIPDTPDGFGNAAAINFGGVAAMMFNADGQFTDGNGNIINGSVYIGRASKPLTARALTIFGPTSTIRTYRWSGASWRH